MSCPIQYNGREFKDADELLAYARKNKIIEILQAFGEAPQSYQVENKATVPSTASPLTIKKLKIFAERSGIDIQAVSRITLEGKEIGINGVADTLQGLVQYMEDKEASVLPEELMHVAVEFMEQGHSALFKTMLSRVDKYALYRDVYNTYSKIYLKDGKPDIRKIKKEAMAKILVNTIILGEEGDLDKPEQMEEVKNWWQQFVDWFKSLFIRAGFNPFEAAAEKILSGAVKPTATSGEVFLQAEENDAQENLFNAFDEKLKQFNIEKIEKVEKAIDEDATDSYYQKTVDGKTTKVRRVTEVAKIKNKAKNGGRDYFEDATPAQKEQWKYKAMSGTMGHAYLEKVSRAALNEDGTVKPRAEITLDHIQNSGLNPMIEQMLQEYLLGNDLEEGLLYSFPPGTRFKTEQIIYNEKGAEKGQDIVGATDLIAMIPDGTVEVLDYKFMGFQLESNTDIPAQKRSQHAIQLAEYKKILSQGYGIPMKNISARTIPIHAQYRYVNITEGGKIKAVPVLEGVTLGRVNMKTEERTYLLSVVPDDQSTGVPKIDDTVKSLKSWYKKLYSRKAEDHKRDLKLEELNTLSAAIRALQTSLNFEPLAEQAVQFQKGIDRSLERAKEFKDLSSVSQEELNDYISTLNALIRTAQNYTNLDELFVAAYGEEDLSERQQQVLETLKKTASDARFKRDKVLTVLQNVMTDVALQEGVTNLTVAEKELSGLAKDFRELGSQSNKALQTFYSLLSRTRSRTKLKTEDEVREFGKIYEDFSAWGKGKGKPLFELIANKDGHTLISETKKDLWTGLKEAGKNKDKSWIVKNIDVEEYGKLYLEALESFEKEVARTSDNTEENLKRVNNWKLKYDIGNAKFFGWDNWIIKKTLKKQDWHTEEYKELLKPENAPALAMYNFVVTLNKRAYGSGYLSGSKSLRFLPFIKGTTLERVLGGEGNAFMSLKGSIADRFSVQVDDDMSHSQIDEETGEVKRVIPKFFTTDLSQDRDGKKDYSQISTDLNRIIPLYINALNEYENAQDIEATVEALQIVEQEKGHLEVDKLGNVITQGGAPREFRGNEKNTDILQEYVDDSLYGIKYDRNDWGDKLMGNLSEGKKLSAMKVIEQTNKLTRMKALGLKLLVAIPNYFGANMQAVINAGRLHTSSEFLKNEAKVVASSFQGREGNILKGLLDYFSVLEDHGLKKGMRHNAQSTLEKLKYYSISEVLMSGLSMPDHVVQKANALSILDNTMIENGELVNIRQYLKQQPEWKSRYASGNARQVEKEFKQKVKELQETRSLKKIASFNKGGHLTLPGLERASDTVAKYRNIIISTGAQITGQMTDFDKRLYSRDLVKRSLMAFRSWVPSLLEQRFSQLHYSKNRDSFEYGRIRLVGKIIVSRGLRSIDLMRNVVSASPKGLEYLHTLWQEKQESYLKKNGRELSEEITEEEFFDLIRNTLRQEAKELTMLLGLLSMLMGAKFIGPPDDKDKNLYKMTMKLLNKTSDEILYFYLPTSASGLLQTSAPFMSVLTDANRIFNHSMKLLEGEITGDQDMIDNAHPTKALLSALPVSNYFATELLPLIDPEGAKRLGIVVTEQSRASQ